MDALLVDLANSSAVVSELERLELYQAITAKALRLSDHNRDSDSSSISTAFENRKGVLLPVLLKGRSHKDSFTWVGLSLSLPISTFVGTGRASLC